MLWKWRPTCNTLRVLSGNVAMTIDYLQSRDKILQPTHKPMVSVSCGEKCRCNESRDLRGGVEIAIYNYSPVLRRSETCAFELRLLHSCTILWRCRNRQGCSSPRPHTKTACVQSSTLTLDQRILLFVATAVFLSLRMLDSVFLCTNGMLPMNP